MPTVDSRTGLEVLDRDECLRLLASQPVGRVAVVVDGSPMIFPVNYALDGESIVFRSDAGSKISGSPFGSDHRSTLRVAAPEPSASSRGRGESRELSRARRPPAPPLAPCSPLLATMARRVGSARARTWYTLSTSACGELELEPGVRAPAALDPHPPEDHDGGRSACRTRAMARLKKFGGISEGRRTDCGVEPRGDGTNAGPVRI
jgi:Pyridoxamine 5'-phosphate oxidase